ncbi:condensation domain-containing protein, partial [Streptomyces sp. NPDC098085]|uniref:condensation domain-containing protein n=1 Tax=Streptomyces sp. NPDC098085 TaxID=3366094 RepID=UPI0038223F5D
MALPVDRPRPAVPSYRGGAVSVAVDASTHRRLREVAREHHATLFMVVQAALAAVLTRFGAGSDIPVGTVVAGRGDEALDNLVGFFVNTLVLRTDTSGDPSFGELLERVRRTDLAAYAHQDLPFDRLVEELQPARSLARHPLFQVMLSWAAGETETVSLAGLEVTPEPTALTTVKFDLEIGVTEHAAAGGLDIQLGYAVDLFDELTVRGLGEALVRVLTAAATDPQTRLTRMHVLSPIQRETLTRWGTGPAPQPARTLTEAFARAARSAPNAPAVIDGTLHLSYQQLDTHSNRLAQRLLAAGVTPETPVPVLMNRGAALVIALLAILKAGAAYLPLHLAHPTDRMHTITTNNTSPVLLTDPTHQHHPYN